MKKLIVFFGLVVMACGVAAPAQSGSLRTTRAFQASKTLSLTAAPGPSVADNFIRVGPSESLTVPFTTPITATVNSYSGFVEIIVSGVGNSLGVQLNDAFYLFSPSNSFPPSVPAYYYALDIGSDSGVPLPGAGSAGTTIAPNLISFVDGIGAVAPPYRPAYDATHTYHFVIQVPATAGHLQFGVNDNYYSDNGGAYNIQVFQVQPGAGATTGDPSKVHLTAPGVAGDADGIACDNLSGMDELTQKDKLRITLDYPNVTDITGTVAAPGPNTNDTGYVKTLSDGNTYYFPPDEYNENQVPQNVATDITKPATRIVTLTLHFIAHFGSGGTPYVVTKEITLARPPVVLVHGINSGPERWLDLLQAVQLFNGIRMPFALVNHRDGPGGYGGNGSVERAAAILKQTIQNTLDDVRQGTPLPDGSYDLATEFSVPFTDYAHLHLAIQRVDVVGWSYGGVIARWYINASRANASQSPTWYKRSYDTVIAAAPPFGHDIRKLITLGSMWRGVPLANYLNEALFASTNGIRLGQAPTLVSDLPWDFTAQFNLIGFIGNLPIPTVVPAMEVMAVNSPWMSQLIYGSPRPTVGATPTPFDSDIAYGSVAGDNNAYEATYGLDPYGLVDDSQQPTWFPYLALERRPTSPHGYSDGIVPLWSAAIPGGYPNYQIVPSTHSDYPDDATTQNYIMLWLNNSQLPQGTALNQQWQDTQDNVVQTADGYRTWTFSPSEMAPHPENDVYQQVGPYGEIGSAIGSGQVGIGRINPAALREIDLSETASSVGATSAVVSWVTATESDSRVTIINHNYSQVLAFSSPGRTKIHSVLIYGLQPNSKYFYRVAYSPDGYTVLTSATDSLPSFTTSSSYKPDISLLITSRDASADTFSLHVSNLGGVAANFSIVDINFAAGAQGVKGYGYAGSSPASIPLLGPAQTLSVTYRQGVNTARLMVRVNYRYDDLQGHLITGNSPWLRLK